MKSCAPELRELMTANNLTNRDVATLSGASVKTVESWLADADAASHRRMHARHLKMIRAMLPGFLAGSKRGGKS